MNSGASQLTVSNGLEVSINKNQCKNLNSLISHKCSIYKNLIRLTCKIVGSYTRVFTVFDFVSSIMSVFANVNRCDMDNNF